LVAGRRHRGRVVLPAAGNREPRKRRAGGTVPCRTSSSVVVEGLGALRERQRRREPFAAPVLGGDRSRPSSTGLSVPVCPARRPWAGGRPLPPTIAGAIAIDLRARRLEDDLAMARHHDSETPRLAPVLVREF
jgi:hypothetical protein